MQGNLICLEATETKVSSKTIGGSEAVQIFTDVAFVNPAPAVAFAALDKDNRLALFDTIKKEKVSMPGN